jgi:hypothetical protein
MGLLAFVVFWFQPQKLFIEKTVNEALPGVILTIPGASPPGADTDSDRSDAAPGGGTGLPATGQVVTVAASGEFRSLEHGTRGRALLLRRSDGTLVLRLESLDTSNGPDLRVYLSQIAAGGDWHAYGQRFIDLGPLKGNRGSQNYPILRRIDVSKFQSAVIWCRRFKVGFGVAPLRP